MRPLYEARAHGIVVGFYGLALVSWQAAAEQTEKRLWQLSGLAVAVAGAMLTHTYGLLVILPVGFGELIRSIRIKRLDWTVWLTLGLSSSAILVSVPLRQAFKSFLGTNLFPAGIRRLVECYHSHLEPGAGVLGFLLALISVTHLVMRRQTTKPEKAQLVEPHELTAVLTLIALPVFAFFLAKVTDAPYMFRYTIASVGGFACITAYAMARTPKIALLGLLVLWSQIAIDLWQFRSDRTVQLPSFPMAISTDKAEFMEIYNWIQSVDNPKVPVALTDYLEFAQVFLPFSFVIAGLDPAIHRHE